MTASVVTFAPVWLNARELKRLFAALGAPAVDVRCVGGSIRDAVLGRDRADSEIDVGTPEPPAQVLARLADAHIKAIPTGIDHGTVTAVVDGRAFEITSLRRDTACDGRHAAVAFTTDWHEDARRRDFTMNAMSLGLDGVLHDDHGGAADARAGRVRFVGDPDDRIQEDYLRILRLFRFSALYGREPIDPATLIACERHKAGLMRLSVERIHSELAKLLAAPDPMAAMTQMTTCGVLAAILPEHQDVDALARLIVAERHIPADCPADVLVHRWVRRLAVVIPPSAVGAVVARLKLSHGERERLEQAAGGPIFTPTQAPTPTSVDFRRALFHLGAGTVMDRLLVSRAARPARDSHHDAAAWRSVLTAACAWTPHPLPVGGEDVMGLGIAAGPAIGRILAAMTEWWITAAFVPSRAQALEELARMAREVVGAKR